MHIPCGDYQARYREGNIKSIGTPYQPFAEAYGIC
jgi:hypothetical protein